MNDKLKFYRSTLVQMTKEAYRKMPNELKIEESVVEGELLIKAIMKQVDEFEAAMEQHFNLDKERVNYYFGGDNCVAKDFTCTDPNFFKGVNPDFLKTEPITTINGNPMRTIVDNGPQCQTNQKPYGTLGEHWKELMDLFEMKNEAVDLKEYVEFYKESKKRGYNCYHAFQNSSICAEKRHKNDLTLKSIADSLGIEFIEDFVKACEKCEE